MKNQYTILGAALILGLCLVASSFVIGDRIRAGYEMQLLTPAGAQSGTQAEEHPLLTLAETAQFLRLSEDQVKNIMKAENAMLRNDGPFEGMKLPYLKVDNEFLFNKQQLTVWVLAASQEHRVYMGEKLAGN
ncbi:hypothetical protein MKZ07_03820 [Paenibacillus sp. FSL P4-0338]|uniref:hypothetical protein n=1 Tax=unclassified Paenibacillus TaxID=185978 RepID=UPI0003E1C3D7|nr:hypothetical protein [Paenibacillus sp. FSL R7-269]ETT48712.1 hypothetical protein C162_13853 [Paenibacillus sp. FSL R7-269]